jgi:hypothetical protein
MMFVFQYINGSLGYFEMFISLPMNILLSLICSIIPGSFCVFIVAVVIMAHMVKLSVLLAALVLVVMIIAYLMFLKFAPEQSVVLLAVPVLMHYQLQFAIPVLAGLFFTPYAVVPAVIGLFMVKFIGYTCEAVSLTGTGMSFELDGIVAAITQIIGKVTDDREIWLYAIIIAVTMAVVFVISQFSFDYAWYVAILAGTVAQVATGFFCAAAFGSGVSISAVIIGSVIGMILAVVLQLFKCPLDYPHKEYVQFEDDDYYYYVKAIPKIIADKADTKKANDEN